MCVTSQRPHTGAREAHRGLIDVHCVAEPPPPPYSMEPATEVLAGIGKLVAEIQSVRSYSLGGFVPIGVYIATCTYEHLFRCTYYTHLYGVRHSVTRVAAAAAARGGGLRVGSTARKACFN